MTAVLTVLGALGVLRTCRRRHTTFRFIRCTLQYKHSPPCKFGWVDVGGLACDLDAPPPATQPASAPAGYTVSVAAIASQTPGPVELSLDGVLRYSEYLVPRRRRWWRR